MIQFAIIGLFALILLNGGALFIENAWPIHYNQGHFYSTTISALSDMPYWLGANLLLIVLNGIALIQDGSVRVKSDGSGGITGRFPFISHIILGYNLVCIPVLLLLPRFFSFF